jgi:DNA topoisomerase-1
VQRGDEDRAPIPEDLAPDELTVPRATELLEAGSSERVLGAHPESGLPIMVRAGRFGPYVQVGSAEETDGKPATASLLASMDPANVTLDDALRVLSLPRVVGVDPSSGEEIVASNGRYGPYLKRGSESRSLETEDQLFTVDLDDALARFAEPKTRRGRGASAAPLRELGMDPASGAPIVLREGRFGPYVTDGTTNASLRKGDTVSGITPDRAVELLAERRAAGPRPPRAKKAPAKKAPTKKAVAKKAVGSKTPVAKAGAAKTGAVKTGAKKTSAKKGATQKASAKKAGAAKKAAVPRSPG